MVSKASDDLPEPDSPVMTTSESRGSSTVTSLRLCSRAPVTTMEFWRLTKTPLSVYGGARTENPNLCSIADGGHQQSRIEQLSLEVGEPRLDAERLAGGPHEQLVGL